jgi:hypothetical protein
MSTSRKWIWLAGIVTVALACTGPIGCGGGDDGDGDSDGGSVVGGTTTVVVTNTVTGTTVTNVVVVTNAPPAVPSGLNVVGTWTGNFQTDVGEGQLQMQLQQQGTTIRGQGRLNTGGADQVGNVTGSISGDHMVLSLTVTASGDSMSLDGHVNSGATSYVGNLDGDWGQGQFSLHK